MSENTPAMLIPYALRSIGDKTVQTVNGRDLHAFLLIKQRFNDWIAKRIQQYGFVQDIDFIRYYDYSSGLTNPPIEYFLTFDMCKELSMVEKTTKGKEARLYFLDCEHRAQALQQPQVKNPIHQLLIDTVIRLDAIEQESHAAKQEAEAAKTAASAANENALRALESQLFLTVAEYVYSNKLQAQIPESAYRTCSDHLRLYCLDHRIPFRSIPVGGKAWKEEYAYHSNVYAEVIPGWLTRRFAQGTLHVLPTPEREA